MDTGYLLNLDANILLGIANERLRLDCDSLDDLALTWGVSEHSLAQRLEVIGYHYDIVTNQFKAF
jgi:hypothetical protein